MSIPDTPSQKTNTVLLTKNPGNILLHRPHPLPPLLLGPATAPHKARERLSAAEICQRLQIGCGMTKTGKALAAVGTRLGQLVPDLG